MFSSKNTVTFDDSYLKQMELRMKAAESKQVEYGYYSDGDHANHPSKRTKVPLSQLAAWHEEGVKGYYPARQMMFKSGHNFTISGYAENVLTGYIFYGRQTAHAALSKVGAYGSMTIEKTVDSGQLTPANTPFTKAKKGGSTPMKDTGYLKSKARVVVSNKSTVNKIG